MAAASDDRIPDASAEYHLWDDLVTFGFRLALSTAGDSPEERSQARERLARGMALALRERDEMWARILGRREHPGS